MPSPTLSPEFQPNQIICLEEGDRRLYAEVIDIIAQRALIWARPLLLVSGWSTVERSGRVEPAQLEDLHEAAHLLLPIRLFRAAIDMELLPLFPFLSGSGAKLPAEAAASRMHQFIDQVWQHQIAEQPIAENQPPNSQPPKNQPPLATPPRS
ncbi:MAG: hypothetical protein HC857_07205 [Synechococcales cyanobacterium RU_4_20]|nr:hypothetical protein [Synechococcales cyanobacterium RU_4_20]